MIFSVICNVINSLMNLCNIYLEFYGKRERAKKCNVHVTVSCSSSERNDSPSSKRNLFDFQLKSNENNKYLTHSMITYSFVIFLCISYNIMGTYAAYVAYIDIENGWKIYYTTENVGSAGSYYLLDFVIKRYYCYHYTL